MTELIPQESDPVFSDACAERLYRLLDIKSCDVGFYFNTEMLMLSVISALADVDTDDDCKQAILYLKSGEALWAKIEPVLDQVKAIVQECESE